jgi:hypothetical protein
MKLARYMQVTMTFAWAVAVVVLASGVGAQDTGKETTLTGVVSDAMCGAHHTMKGMSDADCTRMCVKAGQGYVLVVGDRVYSVAGHLSEFDKYAGQKVIVKGKLNGDTLAVESVKPAK